MPTRTCVICFHEKVLFQIPPCGNVGPHREMCTECCARTIMTSGKCPLCRAPFEPEIDFYEYEMTCTAEELPEIFPSLPLDEKMQLIEYFARSGNLEMVNRNSHRMSRLLDILFFSMRFKLSLESIRDLQSLSIINIQCPILLQFSKTI